MDKLYTLKVIWSKVIWDDVHILVRALNWLSVKPPTPHLGGWLLRPLYTPPPLLMSLHVTSLGRELPTKEF